MTLHDSMHEVEAIVAAFRVEEHLTRAPPDVARHLASRFHFAGRAMIVSIQPVSRSSISLNTSASFRPLRAGTWNE